MLQFSRNLTQQGRSHTGLLFAALLSCLLTAACTPLQQGGKHSDAGGTAKELSARGDHVAASRTFLDLAINAKDSQRQRYLVFAAGELYLANDLEGAERILQQAGDDIATENIEVWAEVEAEIRLARNEPGAALSALNRVSSTDRQSAASRILLLRSEALFQLGRAEGAVATLLARESVLTRSEDIAANRRLIWSGMQTAGDAIPPDPKASNGDPLLTGWLQVGHIAFRQRGSLSGLYNALNNWRGSHPNHPASILLQQEVLPNLSALSTYPQQVALLLPLSGKQKAYGEAIRDGFLAAHFELGSDTQRPDVRFYDTASGKAGESFRRATLDGAAFIIGPLLKNQVGEIAPLVTDVTTLALNTLPADSAQSPQLFQFALAPEDEARAAAIRATEEGLVNALALVEDSEWGRRILNAFGRELEARGGKLLSASGYVSTATDFSNAIKKILLLDESYARRDRLAANLGKKLEFEPRRRQDVDVIFLASKAKAARQIKPQLKFHYAGDIPTYATADVYQPGSEDNSDLNGLFFPDIPWLLEPTQAVSEHQAALARHWGTRPSKLARFYAMGYDSYHLTAMLHGRNTRDTLDMSGMTGRLWSDAEGVIHRDLKWARIERGTPRTLPDIRRGLIQDAEIVLSQQQ
jgi:outer membrane PBP1 activator LpoA protein